MGKEGYIATFDGAPSFAFPSHPPIAWPTQTIGNLGPDSKGLAYEPRWDSVVEWEKWVQPLFPDLAVWTYYAGPLQAAATLTLTALYLTATSTATDFGEIPSDLPTYTGTHLPINANGASQVPTTTAGPLASKPGEPMTTLPKLSLGNAPESTSEIRPTSTMRGLASKQVLTNGAVDAATVSLGVANGDPTASVYEATSPTKTIGSEPVPLPPLKNPAEKPGQALTTPSVGITISSTDEQGHVTSSVAQLPAVILTSTNPNRSPSVATSPAIGPALENEAASIIFNNHTISREANAQYLASGQPLVPGSPVTLGLGASATPVAIRTSNSQSILVVGSCTSTLASVPNTAAGQALSIGSQVLASYSGNQYVIGSQTLALVGLLRLAQVMLLHLSSYIHLAVTIYLSLAQVPKRYLRVSHR